MTRIQLSPERLPDDRYTLRIVGARPATSRAGHPMLRLSLVIDCGAHAGHPVTCFYSLLPQARWRLRRLLRALAIPDCDATLDTHDLLNVRVVAIIRSRATAFGPPAYELDDETPDDATWR
jgi:hypothetical protein